MSGAKAWHVRQVVGFSAFPVCARLACVSWHRRQGATPGFLKPSRWKS